MARRLARGDVAPAFVLARAGGGEFDSAAMRGKRWLLAFHRYSL